MRGLLRLYQATGEKHWLSEARALTDTMVELFWDDADGAFYFTLEGADHLLVRTKKPYDSAIPSGNAVAANNLLSLAELTGTFDYFELAEKTLQSFAGMMSKSSGGFMHMLLAANRYWDILPFFTQQKIASFVLPLTTGTETDAVKVSASVLPAGKFLIDVEIHLEIAEGWHVNANPASQDMLIPTSVSLDPDAPAELVSVDYPEGELVHFDFSGESLSVYEGTVTIPARLQRKSDNPEENYLPLDLEIRYQACNDLICLEPTTTKVRLGK